MLQKPYSVDFRFYVKAALANLICSKSSERPIREKSISADTDNRSNLPILSADISAENDAKSGAIFALKLPLQCSKKLNFILTYRNSNKKEHFKILFQIWLTFNKKSVQNE